MTKRSSISNIHLPIITLITLMIVWAVMQDVYATLNIRDYTHNIHTRIEHLIVLARVIGSFVVPCLGAWLLVKTFARECNLSLRIGLTMALGLALNSVSGFFTAMLHLTGWLVPFIMDVAILVVIDRVTSKIKSSVPATPDATIPPAPASQSPTQDKPDRMAFWLSFLLVPAAIFVLFTSMGIVLNDLGEFPEGQFDASHFWLPRAVAMQRGDFKTAFDRTYEQYNYPPLYPSAVSHTWNLIEEPHSYGSQAIAVMVFLATCALINGSLIRKGNSGGGALALMAVLGWTTFSALSAYQYADTIVAMYLLAAFVVREKSPILSGVMIGCAAATKNEGLMMSLFLSLAILTFERRRLKPFLMGLALPLLLVILFKVFVAQKSELAQPMSIIITKIKSPDRYYMLADFVWGVVIRPNSYLLTILPIFALLRWKRIGAANIAAISAIMLGYLLFYLVTPYPLQWQLQTSFTRLVAQVWPTVVFVLLMNPQKEAAKVSRPEQIEIAK